VEVKGPLKTYSGGYVMNNVTTKKIGLSPAIMRRVDSCAYLFMADRQDKIQAIMADREVSELEAGRIYTIGALKAAKRRGTARTYSEALDLLEAEQVGDRGSPLTRTVSADRTARHVSQYQAKNNSATMRTVTLDVVRMAWAKMDRQPYTAYVRPEQWQTAEPETKAETKRNHALGIGRVLGSLYTEAEFRQEISDPMYEYVNQIRAANVHRYLAEYKSRLSRTVQARLSDLLGYVRQASNGSDIKADRIIQALVSVKGREDPETARAARFAVNLHQNFEYKEAVSCPEFVTLLYRYGGDLA
jgi:hypothetical protein